VKWRAAILPAITLGADRPFGRLTDASAGVTASRPGDHFFQIFVDQKHL
jgi:hypothetical protein